MYSVSGQVPTRSTANFPSVPAGRPAAVVTTVAGELPPPLPDALGTNVIAATGD